MDLLLSFCGDGRSAQWSLGLLDLATTEFHLLHLPLELHQRSGIAGLAADSHFLYAALCQPAGLLVLDRRDLSLLNCHWLGGAGDAHSLCLDTYGDEIYDLLPVEDTHRWPLSSSGGNGFLPGLEITP